jgi:hypothetical protein
MEEIGDLFDMEDNGLPPSMKLDALRYQLEVATKLEAYTIQMEEDLKAAKKHLNDLKTFRIPEIMSELQISSIVWKGWKCSVAQHVSGSLPKDPVLHEKAINWLTDHEAGDIIKTSIGVDFSISQHNEALDLSQELQEKGYLVGLKSGVHPQTLCAWVRERLKEGDDIDADILGVYIRNAAAFKKVS